MKMESGYEDGSWNLGDIEEVRESKQHISETARTTKNDHSPYLTKTEKTPILPRSYLIVIHNSPADREIKTTFH